MMALPNKLCKLAVAQQRQGLDTWIMQRFFVKFNIYTIQFMDTSVGNIGYLPLIFHIGTQIR